MTHTHSLVLRAFGGLITLIVVIALMLFLPAGTFHYWQAWTFLILFSILVTLITLRLLRKDPDLLERRIKAGPLEESRRTQKIIQSFANILFVLPFILAGLD